MSEFLINIFDSFDKQHILIIGDVMIDAYLWGKVDRISPEAPVPILHVVKKEDRLGGAANVALNIQSLGAKPILCSVVGDDAYGQRFKELLNESNISGEGIIQSSSRTTTVKTRLIGHHQQLMRIDEENDSAASADLTAALASRVEALLRPNEISAIIFEDYDKGVITPTLISEVVALAAAHNIPVVVDPKKRNFLDYKNVQLFKPNLKELKEGLKLDFDHTDKAQLISAARQLKERLNADMVMITLSEHGVMILKDEEAIHTPAHVRNISDVSGAGDTVISVAALGLAVGMSPKEFSELANLAGGLVCEKVGVVPIDKTDLLNEAIILEDH